MSLDGIAMRALAQDLRRSLQGGRIDKITQPNTNTLTMTIRANNSNHKLFATTNPQSARVSLTAQQFKNPLEPPQFCMVMRKHLQGAIIEDIHQIDWERMIQFQLRGRNEIGEETRFSLVFELMGKNSNIVLLSSENIILDAIRRAGANTNQVRQFQPGIHYQKPPAQNKIALENLSEDVLSSSLIECGLQKSINKALLNTIAGIGPQTAYELLVRANIAPDTRIDYLGEIDYARLYQQCKKIEQQAADSSWQPTLIYRDSEIYAFAPFKLMQFEHFHQKSCDSMPLLLEDYYAIKEQQEIFSQKKNSLSRIVSHEIERCEKKLQLQTEKIEALASADAYRIKGELITANLYRIKQGPVAEVENFYIEGNPIEKIELNPTKTPNENAQIFFKKYNKAKIGAEKAAIQAEKTSLELTYLHTIYDSIEQSMTAEDLIDIRIELEDAGYAKKRQLPRGKVSKHLPTPMHLFIDGYEVYIGKNNQQNDYVTQKIGRNADLWLHTKDIHGAHIIVKARRDYDGFSDAIIEKATILAAWFSKAKFSSKVPVDYTLRKNVHKPSGAKPGMVIYTDQKTIYATPDENIINELLLKTEAD